MENMIENKREKEEILTKNDSHVCLCPSGIREHELEWKTSAQISRRASLAFEIGW